MLDARRLTVLCEVARRGSFSGAAQVLHYTPSAVSQQIAALEREVGFTLVERRSRGVVLTAAGRVLVEHATRALAELAAAEVALDELFALRSGSLRVASFATAGATIVPAAVDAFRALYPDVEVLVQPATSEDGIARLRQGRVDVVLTVDQDESSDVEITELFTDPFHVAIHRHHPQASSAALELMDLASEPLIDVPADVPGGGVAAKTFAQLGVHPRVTYESDDYTAIHELVGAGLGVALLPDLALLPPNDNVVLRSLGRSGPSRRIQAATRPGSLRSTAASAMLHVLQEQTASRRSTVRADQPVAIGPPSRYPAA